MALWSGGPTFSPALADIASTRMTTFPRRRTFLPSRTDHRSPPERDLSRSVNAAPVADKHKRFPQAEEEVAG